MPSESESKEILVLKLRNGEDIICEVEFQEEKENAVEPMEEPTWLLIRNPLRLLQQFNFQSGDTSLHMIPWNPFSDETESYLLNTDVIHYSRPSIEVEGNYIEIASSIEEGYAAKNKMQKEIQTNLKRMKKKIKSPEDLQNVMTLIKMVPDPTKKH